MITACFFRLLLDGGGGEEEFLEIEGGLVKANLGWSF